MDPFAQFREVQKQGERFFRRSKHLLRRRTRAWPALDIDWREGDAEQLPFADAEFDVVLSQFGHMFASRPDVAVSEMLRVLNANKL